MLASDLGPHGGNSIVFCGTYPGAATTFKQNSSATYPINLRPCIVEALLTNTAYMSYVEHSQRITQIDSCCDGIRALQRRPNTDIITQHTQSEISEGDLHAGWPGTIHGLM